MRQSHLFTLLSLVLCFATTFAQIDIDYQYRHDNLHIISSTDNLIYTFNSAKPGLQELILFDASGNKLNRIEINSKTPYTLNSAGAAGENSIFHFSLKNTNLYLSVDKTGNEVTRIEEEGDKIITSEGYAGSENKYYTISEVKGDDYGLKVELLNESLENVWSFSKFPEKGKFFLELADVNEAGEIGIIYRQKNDYYFLSIGRDGEEIANQLLDLSACSACNPYKLIFQNNGELLLLADYQLNDETGDFFDFPSGVKIMTFGKTGDLQKTQSLSFDSFSSTNQIRDLNGRAIPQYALRITDVTEVNNEQVLVAEAYAGQKRTVQETSLGSTTPSAKPYFDVSFYDLFLLPFNDIENKSHRIWKPSSSITLKGMSTYTSVNQIFSLLEDAGLQGYQGSIGDRLLVKGVSQNFNYITRIDPTKNFINPVERQYYGKPVELVQKHSVGSGFSPNTTLNNDGILTVGDATTLYNLNTATGNLEFSIIK